MKKKQQKTNKEIAFISCTFCALFIHLYGVRSAYNHIDEIPIVIPIVNCNAFKTTHLQVMQKVSTNNCLARPSRAA